MKRIHFGCISFAFLAGLCLLSFLTFTNFYIEVNDEHTGEIVVRIDSGYLNGSEKFTVLNHEKYFSFQGIPYAEPPKGNLRFKEPKPAKPWDTIRNATKHGEICLQSRNGDDESDVIGSEDCLFLNVYTPVLPKQYEFVNYKPVMVWIHGGGFTFGSGNDDLYGPDFLIEKGVVVVTLNYRLGVLGFLNLGTEDAPGNVGLKDQLLALKWVKDNIINFGGNPNSVTLFGQSAGAASVHYHTLSQESKGLFHRVIMQSGSALNPWAYSDDPYFHAFKLGESLGISNVLPKELVTQLRRQRPQTLIAKQCTTMTEEERQRLTFPFVPSKEMLGTGNNFLTEHPEVLVNAKKFAEMPYIIGMTSNEGLILLPEDESMYTIFEDKNHTRFVPRNLCHKCEALNTFSEEIRKFYFENNIISYRNVASYADLCSDLEFVLGIQKTIKSLAAVKSIPIYMYLFTFDGLFGIKSYVGRTSEFSMPGATHSDDVGYLFQNNFTNNELTSRTDGPEMKVIQYLTELWTNFAKDSDPKITGITWETTTPERLNYLEIGEQLRYFKNMNLYPGRTQFWDRLYKLVK